MDNRERVLKYGIEVFNGDLEKFSNWLLKENISLGGAVPNELLKTEKGIKQVKILLTNLHM